jgi:Flp pilus assembly protein TadG
MKTPIRRASRPPSRESEHGQSLVEFSLVLIPFLLLLMGIFDLGRGIYAFNGASQAAREIARSASTDLQKNAQLGESDDTRAVKATQRRLVPGLTESGIEIDCVDIQDNPPNRACLPGDFVRVRVTVPYSPVTPLLGLFGPFSIVSVSHLEIV